MQKSKTLFILTFSLFTFIFQFLSCKKKDNVTPVFKDSAKIMFVHGAANTASVDFLLGSAKKNADSIKYGKNTAYYETEAAVGKKTAYAVALSKSGAKLMGDSIQLTKDQVYSLFAYQDSTANNPFGLLFSIDDLALPSPNKAKIRIMHLVPDGSKNNYAPFMDVQFVPAGTAYNANSDFKGLRFKGVSQFIEMDKGVKDMWVKIGNTTNPITNLKNITISEGKIYTFVLRGFVSTQLAEKVVTITQVANN